MINYKEVKFHTFGLSVQHISFIKNKWRLNELSSSPLNRNFHCLLHFHTTR